jgi:two-component system, response regulator
LESPKPVEILLVEDNSSDAMLTTRALEKCKLANCIHLVRDGEEALDFLFRRGKFASRSPDTVPQLVLLDLKLPKVDGIEVLRELKGDARTRSIPVVVLTTSKEERDLIQTYELGVNSYIQKPVNFSEFQEVVRQLGMYWLLLNSRPPGLASRGPESKAP